MIDIEGKDTSGLPKLSPKQLGAVRHYLLNGNKTDAYRKNYDCSKMKPETINRKAMELFSSGTITAWIEHFQKSEERAFTLTFEEKLEMLTKGAKFGLRPKKDAQGNLVPTDLHGMKSCISEINRMEGHHAPVKSEPLQVIIKEKSILDGIDLEKLTEEQIAQLESALAIVDGLRAPAGGKDPA